MRRNLTLFFLIFSLLLTAPRLVQAQSGADPANELIFRPVQVSFVPGLSTNGLESHRYATRYSFNILAGYNGALRNGYEFGTLANINKYHAEGIQLAGIGNISGRDTDGLQLAGVANVAGRQMNGIQLAGVGNGSFNEMQGLQLAGVLNVSGKNMEGIQLAGTVNLAGGSMQGLQFSGAANLSRKSIQGLQFTGGLNMALASAQGLQFSGVANLAADEMQGLFFTGGVNYARSLQGIAVGTVNANEEVQGLQIGVVNGARKMQGIQIGVINLADQMKGVPVGLISFVREGRHNIDVFASETGFTNVGLKLGTKEVYNMISIGINTRLDPEPWQVGWSIGRHKNKGNGHFKYSDFSIFHINEGNGWTDELNNRFTYRIMFGRTFSDGFAGYLGPTFNMLVSRSPLNYRHTYYDLYSASVGGREYRFWVGISGGIQLF